MDPQTCDVFVIDDDEDTREAIRDSLLDDQLQVEIARDGLEGLTRLRNGLLPSVVLLDAHMAEHDGLTLLAELQRSATLRHLPVVLTTGDAFLPPQPVVATLLKPFTMQKLRETIGPLVRRSHTLKH